MYHTLYVIKFQVMAEGEQVAVGKRVAVGKQVAMGVIAQQPVTAALRLRQKASRSEHKQRRYPHFCFAREVAADVVEQHNAPQ